MERRRSYMVVGVVLVGVLIVVVIAILAGK
jgi:hypothetical protein